jgi:hypothetical protein
VIVTLDQQAHNRLLFFLSFFLPPESSLITGIHFWLFFWVRV